MPEVIDRTVFSFDELSDEAKEKAREKTREWATAHDWWDAVYEDAAKIAELLGIEIDTRGMKSHEPNIMFSGFSSQGDGASFTGHYKANPDACKAIAEYAPQDEILEAIARDLTLMQITSRFSTGSLLGAHISVSGHYCHSGTMDINPYLVYELYNDDLNVTPEAEKECTRLMRAFADWIYDRLEAEHEYLTSDEVIDEQLADEDFNEDGTLI